jgi:glucose-1-phosphate cytidylyltransferase
MFQEKPPGDGNWVNAGFFVLEKEIFDYIENENTIFESSTLKILAEQGQLKAYYHSGFWMPMDKLSDKIELEKLWNENKAPWRIWSDG